MKTIFKEAMMQPYHCYHRYGIETMEREMLL